MTKPLPRFFDRFRPELETELRRSVGDRKSPLYDMLRYHMDWVDEMGMPQLHPTGERVHGTLCLLSAEAIGCPYTRALPAAVAVELLHGFSQIHQDIRHGTPARGHRPAVWWAWGHAQGINAGDGMYALARLAAMEMERRGVPPETVLRAVVALDRCCLELCDLQFLEIDLEVGAHRSVQEYLRILEGTSGALMGCAAELGALAGGRQDLAVEALRLFGRKAGVAFHIRRELDALWGEAPAGESHVIDILDGGRSLPVLFALATATAGDRERLDAISRRQSAIDATEIEELLSLFERVGARRYAQDAAERHLSEALDALCGSGIDSPALSELEGVARYLARPEG